MIFLRHPALNSGLFDENGPDFALFRLIFTDFHRFLSLRFPLGILGKVPKMGKLSEIHGKVSKMVSKSGPFLAF